MPRLLPALAAGLLLAAACRRPESVLPGDAVTIRYELSAGGKVLESDFDGKPIVVYQGTGDLPPGADRALVGMKPGDERTLTLSPADAFGPYDPKKVRTMALSDLGAAGRGLKAGRKVLGFLGGRAVEARVLSVSGGKAVLDLNRPLAGKTVVYRLKVLATKSR